VLNIYINPYLPSFIWVQYIYVRNLVRIGSKSLPEITFCNECHNKKTTLSLFIFIYSYVLQASEQNIKISIKQTQTQSQNSMPHGRRRAMTPSTRDQK